MVVAIGHSVAVLRSRSRAASSDAGEQAEISDRSKKKLRKCFQEVLKREVLKREVLKRKFTDLQQKSTSSSNVLAVSRDFPGRRRPEP